jgi:Lipase (class 3)
MRLTVNAALNESLREEAVINNLKKLDRALLNSALSYAVYTKNKSWFESWVETRQASPNEVIPTDVFVKKNENFNKDRLYDRAFAALIANKMNPVELDLKKDDQHVSKNYLYDFDSKYEKGVYKAMDNLAAATALTSKNGDGTNTLHVSFRGTDNQAQPFMKFLLKAYPDMRAYYDSCKPFEEAILKYAADPKNRISKIEVSGHSLGGAMVQHFFKSPNVRNSDIPMQGFTYGSPPAIANSLYAILPAIRHLIKNGNVKNLISTIKDMVTFESFSKDPKITQYQHVGDIVPKVGNMFMDKSGAEITTLKDTASKSDQIDFLLTGDKGLKHPGGNIKNKSFLQMADTASETVFKKPIRFLVRMSQTVYHDMARYTVNLDAEFKKVKEANSAMLNKNNINLMYTCPNAHNFQVTCNSMRLKYQSQVKLLGGPETDFNTELERGANMQKMDFSKLLDLTKKFTNKEAPTGPLRYKQV